MFTTLYAKGKDSYGKDLENRLRGEILSKSRLVVKGRQDARPAVSMSYSREGDWSRKGCGIIFKINYLWGRKFFFLESSSFPCESAINLIMQLI